MAFRWNGYETDSVEEIISLRQRLESQIVKPNYASECQKPVGSGSKYYPCHLPKGHEGLCE